MSILVLNKRLAKGAPLTNAEGDANWVKLEDFMNSVILNGTENLNSITAPGKYHQAQDSGATLALNYPIAQAGMLSVASGQVGSATNTTQMYQEYTSYDPSVPWKYYRNWYASQWGPWFKLARADLSYTKVFITSPVDANTLVTPNTVYQWESSVPTSGANWPQLVSQSGAGNMTVVVYGSGLTFQRVVYSFTGLSAVIFERQGNSITGVWGAWRLASDIPVDGYLPAFNAGDAWINGGGLFRWVTGVGAYVLVRSTINVSTTTTDIQFVAMGGLALNGAIIELGSNANGTWIKYGDGTMMAFIHRFLDLAGAVFTSNGAFSYYAIGGVLALPAAFISDPIIVAASFGDANVGARAAYLGYPGTATTTGVSGMYLVSPNTSPPADSSGIIRYVILGRWK